MCLGRLMWSHFRRLLVYLLIVCCNLLGQYYYSNRLCSHGSSCILLLGLHHLLGLQNRRMKMLSLLCIHALHDCLICLQIGRKNCLLFHRPMCQLQSPVLFIAKYMPTPVSTITKLNKTAVAILNVRIVLFLVAFLAMNTPSPYAQITYYNLLLFYKISHKKTNVLNKVY